MGATRLTPSQQAKAAGLKSLAEFSKISDVSTRTLENWHKHNPQRFAVMLDGAVLWKNRREMK